MYAIRERYISTHEILWWSESRGWTPASNEATPYESREDAERALAEIGRECIVVEIED